VSDGGGIAFLRDYFDYRLTVKRMMDVVAASLLLLASLPLSFVVTPLIMCCISRSFIIRQERIGLHGRRFTIFKFRSMLTSGDCTLHRQYMKSYIRGELDTVERFEGLRKLATRKEITRLGQFIRRSKIDEIPQLINVLRGDMSMIGPRPAIPYEVEWYTTWHKGRFTALPGITGLSQVSGGDELGFDRSVEYDLEYIKDIGISLDIRILVRTLCLLFGRGGGEG